MRVYSDNIQAIVKDMSIDEKVAQLSCTFPLLFLKHGKVNEPALQKHIPNGIGRMTQFAGGFFEGPKEAAKAYNIIQKFIVEHNRHHIPALMQNESLAGLVSAKATAFPTSLALASTFTPDYARQMGNVICEEAKALGIKMTLSPVADVARDARWGRIGETFGEDSFLTTQFSVAKVKGLQKDNIRENVGACAKHFMGYAASESGINKAKCAIPKKELLEVYGTPFAAMIKENDLESVMVTYSEIDGLPMSIHAHYTKDILRDHYGFNGVAICDALSIPSSHNINGVGNDMIDVVKWALEAGIDADTPITQAYGKIKEGIEVSRIEEASLDEAVLRVLDQKERLGLFDSPFIDENKVEQVFGKQESMELSEEIARKAVVLLKNKNLLPLSKSISKIAVIGPFAKNVGNLFGGYAYTKFIEMFADATIGKKSTMEGVSSFMDQFIDKEYTREVLHLLDNLSYDENIEAYIRKDYDIKDLAERLEEEFPQICFTYAKGIGKEKAGTTELQHAKRIAEAANVIILTLGEVTGFGEDASSGEGANNASLNLPQEQIELIKELSTLGKPILLLLFNGRPLMLTDIEPYCDAILEVWYPGPYAPRAIAQTLSGVNNPGGKLTLSFPKDSNQCPIYYGNHAGSGYMNLDHSESMEVPTPLYPFGFGLSYTTFHIDNMKVMDAVQLGDSFEVSIDVCNTGTCAGDETIQLYTRTKQASVVRPVMELRAFYRVSLISQETKRIVFTLHTKQFGYYNRFDEFVLEPSLIECMIATSSANIIASANIKILGETLNIERERVFDFGVQEIK